jgi:hypothetical protein
MSWLRAARVPSLKTLREAFPNLDRARGLQVRSILRSAEVNDDVETVLLSVAPLLGILPPEVQVIEGEAERPTRGWGDVVAVYINTGDTYKTTLLFDVPAHAFHAISMGAWVEWRDRRYRINPCDGRRQRRPAGRKTRRASARGARTRRRSVANSVEHANPGGKGLERAANLFGAFHGTDAKRVTKKTLPDMKHLVRLGRATAIGYASDKQGGRKGTLYMHEFTTRPMVAATADGKALLIVGGRLNVTPEGITG